MSDQLGHGQRDGHLGDLISAYADGELRPDERTAADAHLAACSTCREEMAATQRAKQWVTELPAVPAPFGFYERLLLDGQTPSKPHAHWPVRLGAISLAATASIWFGVIGLAGMGGSKPGVLPGLSTFVNRHLHTNAPKEEEPATAATKQEATSLGLPTVLPGGYQLYRIIEQGPERWALYTDYTTVISVFIEPAVIDASALPYGSTRMRFDSGWAWLVPTQAGQAVLSQRGDWAVLVMGPVLGGPSVAEDVRPGSMGDSIADRLEGAGRGIFEAFGLG
jgi:hypothetical protein